MLPPLEGLAEIFLFMSTARLLTIATAATPLRCLVDELRANCWLLRSRSPLGGGSNSSDIADARMLLSCCPLLSNEDASVDDEVAREEREV